MTDVFVSYKAEDRRRVQILVDALSADGLSVWWDMHVGSGDDWRDLIQKELDDAKCVVVIWSKRSVGPDGKFVRDEASRAERRHVYVPIRIDKVEPPLGFGETQAVLFAGWTGNRSDPRYRALLETVRAHISGRPHPAHVDLTGLVLSRRTAIVGSTTAVAAAAAGSWLLLKPGTAAASNRIAVLPFANLSGDPAQAYFSDGIAEELRSSLSRAGMQVIGRVSSEAVTHLDTRAAAAKLGVANILIGSVRRSPSTIRIEAQLVGGSDGVEHWAQSYDRAPGDAIKIETDIAENVTRALSLVLTQAGRAALTIGGTTNVAAHDLFLRALPGIYSPSGEADIARRVALFDAAISLDPNYADAYVYKAFLLALMATDDRGSLEALSVANHAISIAPRLAHAYDVRGFIYWGRHQMGPALANARHAMDLNGEDVNVLGGYSNLLAVIGKFDEALRINAKAIALDPLEPTRYRFRSNILFNARRYSEAADNARRAIELQPDYQWNWVSLIFARIAQGKTAQAQSELGKLDATSSSRLGAEALIAARKGERSQALVKLDMLRAKDGGTSHATYAEIYAQLGMNDDAFKELYPAAQRRDLSLVDLRADVFLDPLRRDPRWVAVERQVAG